MSLLRIIQQIQPDEVFSLAANVMWRFLLSALNIMQIQLVWVRLDSWMQSVYHARKRKPVITRHRLQNCMVKYRIYLKQKKHHFTHAHPMRWLNYTFTGFLLTTEKLMEYTPEMEFYSTIITNM